MAHGHKDYSEIMASINAGLNDLRPRIPDTLAGFSAMAKAATADGVLDKKTKELIALAIGVAKQCDACIGFHTRTLVKLGASEAEIAETLGMAAYMGGGPSLMYAADAWNAFRELEETKG